MAQSDPTPTPLRGPGEPVCVLDAEDVAALKEHRRSRGWRTHTWAEFRDMPTPRRWRPVPLCKPGKFKCQVCEQTAHYVTIRPSIVSHFEPLDVVIECKRCGIKNDVSGYWFDLDRWFEDGGYTMRDHIIDDKHGGEITVLIVDAILEAQRITGTTALKTPAAKRLISSRTRFAVLQRDGFRCALCGRTAENDRITLHVDHQQPVSKGGSNTEENLWTLCADCNLGKADKL